MELKGSIEIQKDKLWNVDWMDDLMRLYYPILGKDAILLYMILRSSFGQKEDLESFIQHNFFTNTRFDAARKKLEQYGLVKTYYDGIKSDWLIILYCPLDAKSFFEHDTYSRILLNEVGSNQFDRIKMSCLTSIDIPKSMHEISEPFDISILDSWNDRKEEAYSNSYHNNEKMAAAFDFDTFLQGMNRIFPMRLRTKGNLNKIAELASIYGIDAVEMKKYVQRSINPHTGVFDQEKLKSLVFANKKVTTASKDPYSLGPVQFLSYKQGGMPVAAPERRLIEKLVTEYKLPAEVVNVLIEFSLERTNQRLNASFVEKVAASWMRLKIDSKEKALQNIQQTNQKKEPELPDWYSITESTEPDEDLLKKALELQRKGS